VRYRDYREAELEFLARRSSSIAELSDRVPMLAHQEQHFGSSAMARASAARAFYHRSSCSGYSIAASASRPTSRSDLRDLLDGVVVQRVVPQRHADISRPRSCRKPTVLNITPIRFAQRQCRRVADQCDLTAEHADQPALG
jgi:hypothetical protein